MYVRQQVAYGSTVTNDDEGREEKIEKLKGVNLLQGCNAVHTIFYYKIKAKQLHNKGSN